MIYPDPLQRGDKVCIVSPAGKIDADIVISAIDTLHAWGLDVTVSPHALDRHGRFASTVEHRLQDFLDAVQDSSIRAILCARGGYGAIQLLESISPELIQNNPKWLIGFSDITLLHALFFKSEVVSIHAPMAKHLKDYPTDLSSLTLKRLLFGEMPSYQLPAHLFNRNGYCSGNLVGGNLAVMGGLRGTPYDFDYSGKILFIEDIAELPYKIERYLYNLKIGGVFNQIVGLIVGQFTACEEDSSMGATIYENIRQLTASYKFPVCFNFPCGHVDNNLPLLEGAKAELIVTDKKVTLRFIK